MRIIASTLFLALVDACWTFSASDAFKTFFDDIHRLCSLLLFRIASQEIYLIGTLPLVFHDGIVLNCFGANLFQTSRISDLKEFHNSTTDLLQIGIMNFSVQIFIAGIDFDE